MDPQHSGPPLLTTDADVVVRTFLDALASGSTRMAADLLTEDVWWENIGLPVVRGKREVVRAIAVMHRRAEFDVETHHLAVEAPRDPTDHAAPTIVLTERTDILGKGAFRCEFWVCGRFEVRDGLICGWRDYFSKSDMIRGAAVGLARAVRASLSGRAR